MNDAKICDRVTDDQIGKCGEFLRKIASGKSSSLMREGEGERREREKARER